MKKSDAVLARKKIDAVRLILPDDTLFQPQKDAGLGFAPTNIALCKYWGKRDLELNLPVTSSLSIALPDKGAMTTLHVSESDADEVLLNGKMLAPDSAFVQRLRQFLDVFRAENKWHLHVDIQMQIPLAAGLASSACGFASLVCAMNDLFSWHLALKDLSILARLGSGSAARSLWSGFVEWHAGLQADGMDSFAEQLPLQWPALRIGILSISAAQKPISSRDAMLRTVNSSVLYSSWPKKVSLDLAMLKQALKVKNFSLLGGTAESNALAMHATMMSSWPPVCYYLPETMAAMHKVWKLRAEGLELFFTQDAGPNLKLLFMENDEALIEANFPGVEMIKVFE